MTRQPCADSNISSRNILNSAPILTYNQVFNATINTVNPSANWLSPQSTLQPRFVKFSAQIDF